MILFALLMVALLIAVIDSSDRWLDDETQNILYYDATDSGADTTDSGVDIMEDKEGANNEQQVDLPSDGNGTPDEADTSDRIQSEDDISISDDVLDEMLQSAFEQVLPNSGLGYGSDLDEIHMNEQSLTSAEVERDVTDLFNSFKDMI